MLGWTHYNSINHRHLQTAKHVSNFILGFKYCPLADLTFGKAYIKYMYIYIL